MICVSCTRHMLWKEGKDIYSKIRNFRHRHGMCVIFIPRASAEYATPFVGDHHFLLGLGANFFMKTVGRNLGSVTALVPTRNYDGECKRWRAGWRICGCSTGSQTIIPVSRWRLSSDRARCASPAHSETDDQCTMRNVSQENRNTVPLMKFHGGVEITSTRGVARTIG